MKKILNLKVFAILVLFVLFPSVASAATVYLEATRSTISVGDTAVVAVKINADGGVLNTVDGQITLKSTFPSLAVQEFSLAHSAFGLWPRTPSLSQDGKNVTFVGGVPGGFSIEGATLFSIIVEAKKEGVVTLSPQNMFVYANDGKGTKMPVTAKDLTINVVAKKPNTTAMNDWAGIVGDDRTPPEDFIIVLGQADNLFEGKKFAFFSAVGNQSGIDYYEVSENGAPAVRSGSTYVLQDQGENVKLDVTAYDKAGNKKTASLGEEDTIAWPFIIVVVIIGIIIKWLYKRWRNKRNAQGVL